VALASTDGTTDSMPGTLGPESVLPGGRGAIGSVAYSRGGTELAAAGGDGTVWVWDARTGEKLRSMSVRAGGVWGVAYRFGRAELASAGGDGTVRVWNTYTGKELQSLSGHIGGAWAVAYRPDGGELASAGADGTIRIWDTDTGKELQSLSGHIGGAWAVAYRPDGAELAVAGADGTVRIWDTDTGQELHSLSGHVGVVCEAVAYRSDGAELAVAGADGTVRIWDTDTGQELHSLSGQTPGVSAVAYRSDGAELAAACVDGTVTIWDTSTYEEPRSLSGQTGGVSAVAYRFGSAELAAACVDGTVRVWDTGTGKEVKRLNRTGRSLVGRFLALAITLGACAVVLVIVLGRVPDDGRAWTWSLHAHANASPLRQLSARLLLLDCLLVVVYVCAAFSWLSDLRKRAADVKRNDPHRFGPASRRIHQWAGFGTVLVAAAGLADLVENGLMFANLNRSPNYVFVDAMRALAWLKMINLGVGLSLLAVASVSAFWRLRVERVDKTVPPNAGALAEGRRWTSGRNQSPSEFAPKWDEERPGICLSGGGIRSASFSLGALQAIQNSTMKTPRFITSVSGGAYMAGAWQSMRSSVKPGVPVFQQRSPEERWVRHHTDYLVSSFSVVVGAIGALLSGLVINLLILLALASVIILPLGWVMGLPHPELRARTPILDIAEQPEVKISDVTYSTTTPLPGGENAPGYRVGFTSSSGIVRMAPTAKASPIDRPIAGCLFPFGWFHYAFCPRPVAGHTVTEAVVAESGDGVLEVVRQPSFVLGPRTVGQPHTGDPDVQSIVVATEPSVSIGALEGSTAGPPSATQSGAVRRSLTIEQQPKLEQRSGTVGREPLSIESWMVFAGMGELLLGGIAWLAVSWSWLARRLRRFDDRHDIPSALALGAVSTFLLLVGIPWFTQMVPSVLGHLPKGPAGGSGSGLWLPTLMATVAALVRYFQPATKALGGLGKVRGGSRVLDFFVGAVAFSAVLVVLATLGNTAVANGPNGKLPGAIGSALNLYLPSLSKWGIALLLLVGWWLLGPRAHAWSLFTVYRNRLNKAYMLEPDGRDPTRRSVSPRYPKSWKWGQEVGRPSSSPDDLITEWVVCTTANIRGSGEAAPGRSGGSFTFSREWVGGPEVGWMRTDDYMKLAGGQTDVDVGSSIAISGAAFSPAMGKASVQNQGRLMALLNLRLGVWVPNPMLLQARSPDDPLPSRRWKPAWPWYFREFVGFFDRTARFVYLTDGGHWENLGLVELLRRGCSDIWMVSAAGDGASSFETLAQAIALAREELGVEFNLDLEPLRSPEKPSRSQRRLLRDGEQVPTVPVSFVAGTFTYPPPEGSSTRIRGKIKVIEAALIGDAPWDVHSYAERNKDFPDISTGYQLMDHRDFEAYRMLGFVQTQRALDGCKPSLCVADGDGPIVPVI
jgi:hypothetical protein